VVGYGLLESRGSRFHALDAGVIRAPASAPMEIRLAKIVAELTGLLARHQPDHAAIEDAFVKHDPRAALMLGQARGAVLAALGAAGLTVASYPPATVKKAVTGHGRATKEQVARMVTTLLGMATIPEPQDATDALAVALTHALRLNTQHLGLK